MTRRVHIVDYGAGNLFSVARAIEKAGGVPVLTEDLAEIAAAERLVLPGVGAFRDGMSGLTRNGLGDAIQTFAATGRPLLGICLGMQMLADRSHEFGTHDGLGLIPGNVVAIPRTGRDGRPHKVPFIGWAALEPTRVEALNASVLAGSADCSVYLVHSYHVEPQDPADILAVYRYDDVPVTAAIQRDNVLGCQFHPEKSGPIGLAMISRFIEA